MSSSERLLGAAIVEHLCEVEARGLHLDIGFGSLFQYCIEQLGFSVGVAFKRVRVAKVAAARPRILEHLESGELSLSSVVVIASHLDEVNETEGDELVEAARGKSKREVERMVVYERDGGVCSFVGESPLGTRQCGSTYQLEYDHIKPRALGGESTVENLRLLCRNHNQRAAEQILGKDLVDQARARARLCRDALDGALSREPSKAAVAAKRR